MTREEAIEILKPFKACMFDQNGCPISDAAIALDVAIEALQKQRTGKWLIAEKDKYIVHSVRCSVCGYCISWMANYCPMCGAKMEGEE